MTPDEKDLLEKVARQVEENNEILRGIRRTQRWGTFMKVFYWVLIIGLGVGVYLGLQPYLKSLIEVAQQMGIPTPKI
jgi:hypothetical protein